MMELGDFAMYVAVLSAIGAQPLAVTTNLNINFLRKPDPADLLAEARLMKIGKRLAVGEVDHLLGGLGRAGRPRYVNLFDPQRSVISRRY